MPVEPEKSRISSDNGEAIKHKLPANMNTVQSYVFQRIIHSGMRLVGNQYFDHLANMYGFNINPAQSFTSDLPDAEEMNVPDNFYVI